MNRRWLVVPLVLLLPSFSMAGSTVAGIVDLGSASLPRIDGPASGGAFGSGALATGDINGDGVADIVIGAPDASQGRGVVYCLFGQAGMSPQTRNLATSPADLTITGPAPGAHVGVAGVVADLDGDGAGDLVISSGGYSPSFGRLSSGGALIFRGGPALGARNFIDLASEHADACVADGTIPVAVGASLAVGDFNHDAFDDLAIGSPASPGLDGQPHAGRVFVLPGGDTLPEGEIIEAGSDTRIRMAVGSDALDEAGTQLAAGDVNGDRIDDLLVGMPNSTVIRAVTFEKAGKVAVVSGPDLRESDPVELSSEAAIVVLGSDFGDYFGFGVAAADVTGDRLPDVVASAIDGDGEMNRRYPDCGEVFTVASVQAATGQRVVDLMDGEQWMRVIGDTPRRFLGGGLAAGDLDGDRRAEIVASSKSAPGPNGMQSGIVYVFEGSMETVDLASSQAGTTIVGPSPASSLGTEVRVVDLTGDGIGDIVATAPGALSGRGSVYVIPGSRTTPDAAPSIETVPDVLLLPGESRSVFFHASDADGDAIRISIAGRPPGSLFLDSGNGEVGLTLGANDPGVDYQVRVTASDGQLSTSTTFVVRYRATPPPVIRKAVYRNGALKITGIGFGAAAVVAVNGRTADFPVVWNSAKGRLKIVASSEQLGLFAGQGSNSVVVTVDGQSSVPFSF